MRVNRGLLFWGVALITAGSVALAASQRWFDPAILSGAWRLWPLVLIAIGISIVLTRTSVAWLGTLAAGLVVGLAGGALIAGGPALGNCSGEAPAGGTSNGTFSGTQASVDLELTCGTLAVTMADGSGWIAQTNFEGGDKPTLTGSASALEIRSGDRGLPFDRQREAWSVQLGRDVTYDFSATLNAADAQLDAGGGTFEGMQLTTNAGATNLALDGAQLADLQLQLNAGTANITIDGASDVAGRLHVNAGSINLCTKNGAAVQITVKSSVAFSHNLADGGLQNLGNDRWATVDFGIAVHKTVLQVEGNAATFTLNPEEGCA